MPAGATPRAIRLASSLLPGLALVWCPAAPSQAPAPTVSAPVAKAEAPPQDANSASNRIMLDELSLFRADRPMTEILAEVHWRGNFELGGIVDGKPMAAISYQLYFKDENFPRNLWAIFTDAAFSRWVEAPEGLVAASIPVGSVEPLRQAASRPAIVMADYIKRLEADYVHRPSDPVLTMIFMKSTAKYAKEFGEGRLRNERRRDQFNAARLKLGLTRADVAATFRAAPLASGTLPAGAYDVFGSTEFIPLMDESLRCPLTLVFFRDDRLAAIYSGAWAGGDREGLDRLRKRLPEIGLPGPMQAEPAPAGPR